MCPGADEALAVPDDRRLADALHRVWGFSEFRPLQREAMHAILESRDSVVVLPTGGGKSLCFQAPALVAADAANGRDCDETAGVMEPPPAATERRTGVAIVVSPLISLMKDQVDG